MTGYRGTFFLFSVYTRHSCGRYGFWLVSEAEYMGDDDASSFVNHPEAVKSVTWLY